MAKLIKLTPNSWIIKTGDVNSGLLFKQSDTYLFLNTKKRLTFSSLNEVENKFGKLKEIEKTTEEKTLLHNGYPVKHQDFIPTSNDPPYYTKGTKIEFAAGYWAIKFNNGWTQAFCPKVSTLENYEHVGPFTNRLEMLNHLTSLNNTEHLKDLNYDKK